MPKKKTFDQKIMDLDANIESTKSKIKKLKSELKELQNLRQDLVEKQKTKLARQFFDKLKATGLSDEELQNIKPDQIKIEQK